jgi:hypothetical protein
MTRADREAWTVGEQLPLAVVLTCCTCDTTYEPTPEAIARGQLGCPDPDCGGWTFSSALTVPPAIGGAR